MYEQTGLAENTHKTKYTTFMEQYFMDDGEKEYYMMHSKDFTQKMIQIYAYVFIGIGKLKCTVMVDLQDCATLYQAGPQWVAYVLHKLLCDKLDRLIKSKIISQLKEDEKSKWSKSYMCVNKLSDEVRLCLAPSKLNDQII